MTYSIEKLNQSVLTLTNNYKSWFNWQEMDKKLYFYDKVQVMDYPTYKEPRIISNISGTQLSLLLCTDDLI